MHETETIGGQEPEKKRSRVKWFTFVFAAALVLLGYRTYTFSDPRLSPEQVAQLARVGCLFFGLGGLALAVGIAGSVSRSLWTKLLDLLEALAFIGSGGFLIALRGSEKGGGLFNSPILPTVLIVIGLIKGFVAVREYQRLARKRPGRK
jgi:peptidoglycan/LPS O-acetylase OafA/YrhL